MRQVRNRVLSGQVPHQMRRARTALQPGLRGDQVRLEVQEANDLPQTQVRAAVREARMRDYAQVLRVFSCGQCSRGCSAGWPGSSCWWQRFCGASFVFGGFGYDSSPQDQWRPYVLSLQGLKFGWRSSSCVQQGPLHVGTVDPQRQKNGFTFTCVYGYQTTVLLIHNTHYS